MDNPGIPSSLPITEFGMSPCTAIQQSLTNKYIEIANVPDDVNQGKKHYYYRANLRII